MAADAGITPEQLAELRQLVLTDYAGDLMLAELRLLRTCNAVKGGHITAPAAIQASRQSSEAA